MDAEFKQVETINEFIDAIRLRVEVFIKEQGFKPGWEPDEDDKISKHFIAVCNGKIVSTARYKETSNGEIKIEAAKMAVESGVSVVIANEKSEGVIQKIINGNDIGTLFVV